MLGRELIAFGRAHRAELFKRHSARSVVALLAGLRAIHAILARLFEEKSGVSTFDQTLYLGVESLDASVVGKLGFREEFSHQRACRGVVLRARRFKREVDGVADPERLHFGFVRLFLLVVLALKRGNLSLERVDVPGRLLQRFKLCVALFNGIASRREFGVDLIEARLRHERAVQALHDLIRDSLRDSEFDEFFLVHGCFLSLITFFTAGEVREIKLRAFVFTAHKAQTAIYFSKSSARFL